MKLKNCNVQGCREEHHARGYCNKHYKKYMRFDDPTAGRFNEGRRSSKSKVYMQPAQEKKRELKRPPSTGQPFAFLVNQKFIERLYKETVKTYTEPLYKAHNQRARVSMLRLAVELAGYDQHNHVFLADFLSELEELAERRDHLRFMDALANWQQRYDEFTDNKNQEQLALPIK